MPYKVNISVLVADDHPLLLKGLYDELSANGYTMVGMAKDGMEALELIIKHQPTIAFLDIDMPYLTGLEVIRTAKDKGIATHFIILSFLKDETYISQAKALQISGYLLKEDTAETIYKCIEKVMAGETFFSPSFNSESLQQVSLEFLKLKKLTPSELTILKLISKEKSNAAIAESLYISIRTVEKHRSNIIAKLELENNPNSLTIWAIQNKSLIKDIT
ncbi:MAG TPA: response regulator transcription factor [Flavobacteriaceae bacterium]|nr:response regulator transcription factor [Flavobacteriaceae bacterium]MCB9212747.1 response regulator transcription factor [Alteromonas sp.]HPF11738.1 response regulator transcription factor [Flavobacteriaceae bacterium]HQU20764.1 response regulator transcription factor [Flavobacteriaceae bacterium]HQU64939.1 response regulator transcription factor [Flavobacteriaceae bacterium]